MASWLVTGGTGSLGNAVTKRLIAEGVGRIAIYSRDELKQAEMAERFADVDQPPAGPLRFMLGDVRDPDRLREAFHGVETVIHAAALKRVDATAYNPTELVRTNTVGTMNVVRAATDCGVKKVLLISSDKAVEPTNPYGGSKLLAEQVAVAMNAMSVPRGTAVSVLRYGNVLGSRGSVLHLWRRQIEAGGPVTLTDPAMTRFALTLAEASGFVLEAVRRMQGGEIFVPVLPSLRVVDLIDAIKEGYANRAVIGRRPGGEKLHETLIGADEGRRTVSVSPDLWAILPAVHAWRSTFDVDGEPFPAGFRYTSDANGWFLSVDELRKKVDEA